MQAIVGRARRYDRATIVFHWLTVILVGSQWLGAQTIDWFPRGPLRIDARSVHITFGALLALLLVMRLVWRLTYGLQLPAADRGLLHVLAKATHWSLYGLLLAMVSVGLFLTWARGDSLFNLVTIPAFDPGNQNLADQTQEIHATIGWIILGMAGLHATAALVHQFIWRDGLLSRMLPTRNS